MSVAQRTTTSTVCGEPVESDILPHALGSLTLHVHTGQGVEIEATGSSFVHFPSVKSAEGELRTAMPLDACTPLRAEPQNSDGAHVEGNGSGSGNEVGGEGGGSDGNGGDGIDGDGGRIAQSHGWRGALVLAQRGGCTFHQKARHAQWAGAAGLVVVDTEEGPVSGFTMSGTRSCSRAALPMRPTSCALRCTEQPAMEGATQRLPRRAAPLASRRRRRT